MAKNNGGAPAPAADLEASGLGITGPPELLVVTPDWYQGCGHFEYHFDPEPGAPERDWPEPEVARREMGLEDKIYREYANLYEFATELKAWASPIYEKSAYMRSRVMTVEQARAIGILASKQFGTT